MSRRRLYTAVRLLLAPLARLLYRLEVTGGEQIPSGPCILVANHESSLDPWVLAYATKRPIRFMARRELWRFRPLKILLDRLGAIPVDRGRGDRAALEHARRLLDGGEIVGIFPQGTILPYRTRPFHRGAARLALMTGVPLVPVCLVGTERALRPRRPKLGLPKLRVLVARPIEVGGEPQTVVAAKEAMRRVEAAIAELRRPYGEPAHVWID